MSSLFRPGYIPKNLTLPEIEQAFRSVLRVANTSDPGLATGIKSIATKVSDYTVVGTDWTILADGSSNTVTVSLPAVPADGQVFNIKCIDDTFTVDVSGSGRNIDGDSGNFELISMEMITVQYDADSDAWWIVQ